MSGGEQGRTGGLLPKGRLEAFADGVLAIVITILVLELHVPEASGTHELLTALGEEWRSYLGYLVSFVFVGGLWVAHSNATRLIAKGDAILFRLNLLVLLFVSVLPFTTSLMTSYLGKPGEGLTVAIYGIDLFIASLLMNVLIGYAARTPHLVPDEIADEELLAAVRERRVLVGIQGAAVLLALVAPSLAVFAYLLIALAFLVVPLFQAFSGGRGKADA